MRISGVVTKSDCPPDVSEIQNNLRRLVWDLEDIENSLKDIGNTTEDYDLDIDLEDFLYDLSKDPYEEKKFIDLIKSRFNLVERKDDATL